MTVIVAAFAISCADAGQSDPETPDAAPFSQADAAPGPSCGDATCDIGAGECDSCPSDCTGLCGGTEQRCGDGACTGTETCTDCSFDCGACDPICGDNVCNGDESCDWCAFDCGACPGVCGDSTCSTDETCGSCEADCGACPVSGCGDLVCDMAGGECTSCPVDCTGLCGGGGGPCAHDWCETGGPLDPSCDPCVDTVCSLDFYCCLGEWDISCVHAVPSSCGC